MLLASHAPGTLAAWGIRGRQEIEQEEERQRQQERREDLRRHFGSLRNIMDFLQAAPPEQLASALSSEYCRYLARPGSDLERWISYLSDLLAEVRRTVAEGRA